MWRTNQVDEPVLIIETIPIDHIGTDPAQAADMKSRRVALPSNLGINETKFAAALKDVVEKTVNYIYDRKDPPFDKKKRDDFDGNMHNKIQDDIAYKVRPLNGVWATPPYLHNGSVPTVYDLLSPLDERPKQFYLGNREYDPVKLGYKTDKLTNGFLFDTSIRGNAIRGTNSGRNTARTRKSRASSGRPCHPQIGKADRISQDALRLFTRRHGRA